MKIMVVEDDPQIRNLLITGLTGYGYEISASPSAEDARVLLRSHHFEAFLLDVMLPGISGTDFCRELRDLNIKEPILILTAKNQLADKITGLDQGADDYITKPFEMAEVAARLRALIRKTQGYPKDILQHETLVLDPNGKTVTKNGQNVDLSPKELMLLEFFMKNPGRLITREMIAQAVWGSDINTFTNIIEVFISHIRKKIETEGAPKLIQTVRGRGFIFGTGGEGA